MNKPDDNSTPETSEEINPVEEAKSKSAILHKAKHIHKTSWQWLQGALSTTKGKVIASLIVVAVLGIGAVAATDLKYSLLGFIYKNSGQIKVLDGATQQPLPGATIAMAGGTFTTSKTGVADLHGLTLGKTTLVVKKNGYKTYTQPIVVPLWPTKFDTIYLQSSGVGVRFTVKDKISGKSIDQVDVVSGESKAVSKDGAGRIVLLPEKGHSQTVKFSKTGYLDFSATVDLAQKGKLYEITLVPAGKVYFLSNRTGRLDLYESNLDGSDLQVALAATGNEDIATGILPNVKKPNLLALLSSREGRRTPSGELIHDLFVFDTSSRKLTKVDESVAFFNYRSWLDDDYLVYEKYNSSNCGSVKAYQVSTSTNKTLAGGADPRCTNINTSYDDTVFYSIQSGPDQGFYALHSNGSGGKKLSSDPAGSVSRPVVDTLLFVYYNYSLPKPQVWRSLNLGTLVATKLDNSPSITSNRAYIESPGEKYSLFIEQRDGKTELFATDINGGNERKLTSLGSVNQFVQWFGDQYIVFSSTKTEENALYVVSADGGTPQKVADFYLGNSRTYGGGYNPNY